MRSYRVPLLLSALLVSTFTAGAAPDRAEAKGLKSFVVKAGTVAAVRSLRKSNSATETEAQPAAAESPFPVQVEAVSAAAPVVAAAPPKPVAPPNTGIACIAGCYAGR